jgi:hypothetical protein
MKLTLEDASSEKIKNTILSEGSYTSAKLGDVVKQRLLDAGLTYPDDFDTTAWTAWTASGKPGDYTATGTWSEGEAFEIIDAMLAGTLSVFGFNRAGKFVINQFDDLAPSPTVDVDLNVSDSILRGGSMKLREPVMRKETVKYNAGASEVSKSVDLSTSHVWWDTARENEPIDCGLDGSTDADTLCAHRLTLLSSEHGLGVIPADSRMLAYNLLDVVKHDFSNHLLPNISTVHHQVYSITEDPNEGSVKLGVWTSFGAPPQP